MHLAISDGCVFLKREMGRDLKVKFNDEGDADIELIKKKRSRIEEYNSNFVFKDVNTPISALHKKH